MTSYCGWLPNAHLSLTRRRLRSMLKCAARNLTAADIKIHARFVKKSELRQTRSRSHNLFGTRVPQRSSVEILVGLFSLTVAISLILAGYFALPTRYRLPADWQEGAGYAMFNFVFVAVWFFRDWGRRSGFWISLLISSTAHALMVHAWIVHVGADMLWRHRAYGKAALLLGLMLFFVVYGGGVFLRRRLYGLKATA
jgi:hypothetical protein